MAITSSDSILCGAASCQYANSSFTGSDQPEQYIHLMDGLIDERAAAFRRPAAFDRTAVVLGRAKPLTYASACRIFPSRPSAMAFFRNWLESSNRCWLTTPRTIPALRAVSIISRAVSRLVAIGFCTCTCFLVSAQISIGCSRKSGNVQTST